jgi:hypothetical protein
MSSDIPASSIVIGDSFVRDGDAAGPHTSGVVPRRSGPRRSSCLNRIVAICDPFQSFQKSLDSLVEQFACAFSVFVFREDLEHAIYLFDLFLDAPDFRQQGLNLEQDCGMFVKRKIVFSKGRDQFRQILNSLLAPDEYLYAARIANEIRFRMLLVRSLVQLLTT